MLYCQKNVFFGGIRRKVWILTNIDEIVTFLTFWRSQKWSCWTWALKIKSFICAGETRKKKCQNRHSKGTPLCSQKGSKSAFIRVFDTTGDGREKTSACVIGDFSSFLGSEGKTISLFWPKTRYTGPTGDILTKRGHFWRFWTRKTQFRTKYDISL